MIPLIAVACKHCVTCQQAIIVCTLFLDARYLIYTDAPSMQKIIASTDHDDLLASDAEFTCHGFVGSTHYPAA